MALIQKRTSALGRSVASLSIETGCNQVGFRAACEIIDLAWIEN
jgi:hypothetical protein